MATGTDFAGLRKGEKEMEVNMFEKVSQLFRSIDSTVIAANILDKAYADGVGKPEYHTPFENEGGLAK